MSNLRAFFVNVYEDGLFGYRRGSRVMADWEAQEMAKVANIKIAYRLRIKLKHEEI